MPAGNHGETWWSLVHRAAAGDGPSRSTFGRAYLPLVRSYLAKRWRGSSLMAEIDDGVQDVFVECFRHDGSLSRADAGKGDFRGYLFGIARNVALRIEARARAGARTGPNGLTDVPDGEPEIPDVLDREWARMLMREAAELMQQRATDDSARRRVELLRMRFGGDLPIHAIAVQWDMDVAAVHRLYARAREEFRLCLRTVVAFYAVRTEAELDDECRRLFELLH